MVKYHGGSVSLCLPINRRRLSGPDEREREGPHSRGPSSGPLSATGGHSGSCRGGQLVAPGRLMGPQKCSLQEEKEVVGVQEEEVVGVPEGEVGVQEEEEEERSILSRDALKSHCCAYYCHISECSKFVLLNNKEVA